MSIRKMLVVCISVPAFFLPHPTPKSGRSTGVASSSLANMEAELKLIGCHLRRSGSHSPGLVDQLDKQLGLIRNYVRENHGSLKELERVRMIHTEGSINGQPREPSFQLAQRFRAEFPADAPVDRILGHLMELGMDRFGDNMSLPESRQSIVVIHFEIQNFEVQLKQIRERCTAEAWKHWCELPTTKNPSCNGPSTPESLQLQSFNLRSTEKVMRNDGSSDYFRIASTIYQPQQQIVPPELLGNVPIHLVGSIV